MPSNSKGKNFVWKIYCFFPLNLRVLPATDSDGSTYRFWWKYLQKVNAKRPQISDEKYNLPILKKVSMRSLHPIYFWLNLKERLTPLHPWVPSKFRRLWSPSSDDGQKAGMNVLWPDFCLLSRSCLPQKVFHSHNPKALVSSLWNNLQSFRWMSGVKQKLIR